MVRTNDRLRRNEGGKQQSGALRSSIQWSGLVCPGSVVLGCGGLESQTMEVCCVWSYGAELTVSQSELH